MSVTVEVGVPVISVGDEEHMGMVRIETTDGSRFVPATVNGSSILIDNRDINSGIIFIHVNTTGGSFDITRVLGIDVISDSTVVSGTDIPRSVELPVPPPDEVYQDREEEYREPVDKDDVKKNRILETYSKLIKNLDRSIELYNESLDSLRSINIPVNPIDSMLKDSLCHMGKCDPSEPVTGDVILQCTDIIENSMKPLGYDFEEYLLMPQDLDGETLVPSDVSNPNSPMIKRSIAERIVFNKSVWDLVKIAFLYLLVLLIEFMLKLLEKAAANWAIRAIVRFVIKRLRRYRNRLIEKLSKTSFEKQLSSDGCVECGYSAKVYLNGYLYNPHADGGMYVVAAFFSPFWLWKLDYISTTIMIGQYVSYSIRRDAARHRMKISDLYQDHPYGMDFASEDFNNAYVNFGTNIYTTYPAVNDYHVYSSRANLCVQIADGFADQGMSQEGLDVLSKFLVTPNKSLGAFISEAIDVDRHVNSSNRYVIEVQKRSIEDAFPGLDLSSGDQLSDDFNSLPNVFNIADSNVYSIFNNQCFYTYIDPCNVLIVPDPDAIRMKQFPELITSNDVNVGIPYKSANVSKFDNNIFVQRAASIVLDAAMSNRHVANSYSYYMINRVNLETQATLCGSYYGVDSDLDARFEQLMDRTNITKKKMDMIKKVHKR